MLDNYATVQRERVSDEIYVFTSDMYAQVTAGVILSAEGAALIDTLAFPQETRQIKHFVEEELGVPIRFVVNTHYHADHTYGNFLFPRARVLGHALCRRMQEKRGRLALEAAKSESRDLQDVEIVLPSYVFEKGELNLHIGKLSLTLRHSPGHSPDSISVLVNEERVLFAGDTMMPLPFFVDGDPHDLIQSLRNIHDDGLENVVQGHGEIVLRGEIEDAVETNVKYVETIMARVEEIVDAGKPRQALETITIDSVGKSRLPLGGAVVQLHRGNLEWLYDRFTAERAN